MLPLHDVQKRTLVKGETPRQGRGEELRWMYKEGSLFVGAEQ